MWKDIVYYDLWDYFLYHRLLIHLDLNVTVHLIIAVCN